MTTTQLATREEAPILPASRTVQAIAQLSRAMEIALASSHADLDRLERMLTMRLELERSMPEAQEWAARRDYDAAMARCQAAMNPVAKRERNVALR